MKTIQLTDEGFKVLKSAFMDWTEDCDVTKDQEDTYKEVAGQLELDPKDLGWNYEEEE